MLAKENDVYILCYKCLQNNVKPTHLDTYVANSFCIYGCLYLIGICVLCDTNHGRHEQIFDYVQDMELTTRTPNGTIKVQLGTHVSILGLLTGV